MQVLPCNKMYQHITRNKHSHNFFGSFLLVNGQNKTNKPNLQNAAKVGGQRTLNKSLKKIYDINHHNGKSIPIRKTLNKTSREIHDINYHNKKSSKANSFPGQAVNKSIRVFKCVGFSVTMSDIIYLFRRSV